MSLSQKTTGIVVGLLLGIIVGAGVMFVVFPPGGTTIPESYTITSSGSTTVYPLSQEWAAQIGTYYPNFQFNPNTGGSGKGQADAASGEVDIGASSSFPDSDYITTNSHVKIIPVSADALAVVANPGVNGTNLKMDSDMVVAIFARNVTTWAEFASTFDVTIQATGDINVYVRSDPSGTTATFAKWLETSDDNTNAAGEEYEWGYGHSEGLSFHPDCIAVDGNPAVADSVDSDSTGIGYVGFAFTEGLTTIDLYNSGNNEWVEASPENALKSLPDEITDPGVNLFNSENDGAYPIARLLFYLINTEILRWETIAFLDWCLSIGQTFIADVGYLAIVGTSAHTFAVSQVADLEPA
jgi:ABC-type phosphate transport system substrate-binding protein